ncbi:MAG: S8 family serine peptidase, partial [Gammaproteobacteria bacterium]|nr:S8 family serine peptidase [Gammaproteobacteria bacterium]
MKDSYYYIVDGEKIVLQKSDSVKSVSPSKGEKVGDVADRLSKSSRVGIDRTASRKELLVVRGDPEKLKIVKTYPDVECTRSAFVDPDGLELVLTDEINVRVGDKKSESKIRSLFKKLNCAIVDDSKKTWRVRVLDTDDDAPLEIANKLNDEKGVEFAEPNVLQQAVFTTVAQPTEGRFTNEWHLHNTGQNGGVIGADVRALDAWGITYGSPGVHIVIHDTGVDQQHPDLRGNVDEGWDFDNDDADASNPGGPHGTACAGVAAAPRNGVGVVGVAPDCRIVPLRAAGGHTWSEWADTFEWAAKHGEIISCSWSISQNSTLTSAIRDAANDGRNGKGVPIFFATGNGGRSPIAYPASLAETIAIGASTNQDVRSGYSQYGNGIDFVAPSSGGTLRIETCDVRGTDGYNNNASPEGDYCNADDNSGFGGTSSATPLAAGIGGLMMSANPGLSAYQIRHLMRGACVRIDEANANYGANGWSNLYGYGRIDAAVAVQRATRPQKFVDNFGYNAGGWRVDRHPRFLADLTADGSADIVGFGNVGVYVALNRGDGTFQSPERVVDNFGYNAGGWRVDRHPRFLADLTGNGSADIVGFGNAGVYVALNNGD